MWRLAPATTTTTTTAAAAATTTNNTVATVAGGRGTPATATLSRDLGATTTTTAAAAAAAVAAVSQLLQLLLLVLEGQQLILKGHGHIGVIIKPVWQRLLALLRGPPLVMVGCVVNVLVSVVMLVVFGSAPTTAEAGGVGLQDVLGHGC